MTYNIDILLSKLLKYDIITFDIFDTLITRQVLKPTDIFLFVEEQVKNEKNFGNGFCKHRIKSEQIAYELYNDKVNLLDIYNILEKEYNYTKYQCNILMNLEIEIEKELIIPRQDMLLLFNKLHQYNKHIILVSDMYLSSDIISDLLNICGYPNNLEIIVSNEKNLSKYKGNLWDYLFNKLKGKNLIHLGDNIYSDIQQVKSRGHEAILIKNPYDIYVESEIYQYLLKYENKNINNSLILGCFINGVCFNSPFGNNVQTDMALGIWLGLVFGCFINWLIENRKEEIYLFVTREGYIFLPLYKEYCKILGIDDKKNILFYASRMATTSASVVSKKDLIDVLEIKYRGKLSEFTKSRLNFILPENDETRNIEIILPKQKKKVALLLEKYERQIFLRAKKENKAYNIYLEEIRNKLGDLPITIVDIGYTGTAQYNLSKIFNEKISGKYIFLDEKVLPEKIGCSCESITKTTDRIHPIYENLLFLEAAIQVPYGQLKQMSLNENNEVMPIFNNDKQTSIYVKEAQKAFFNFVKKEAFWHKKIGENFKYDFSLAEDIWILMIQYNFLPMNLLKCFWLSDDFSGDEVWKYDLKEHMWISKNQKVPVIFSLSKNRLSKKYKLKNFVKRNVPSNLYEPLKYIWIKFIK